MARPRGRDELAATVVAAAEAGSTVAVAGSGHSFTEAAMTSGTMIDVGALSGVIDADPTTGLVRVGAGTVLADLNEELHRLGLAMENLGDIDRQTVAGAISTGTHGTGAKLRNISAQIEEIELVSADGGIHELGPGGRSELLRAARVGIGALGAISAVTLRCVPAFTLRRVDAPLPREEVLDTFQERADSNDHFELFTFPYADSALVLERNRTAEPPRPRGRLAAYLNDIVLENWALEALSAAGKRFPGTIPRLTRLAARLASGGRTIDRSYRAFASERRVRFTEMEYAIPRERAAEALEREIHTRALGGTQGHERLQRDIDGARLERTRPGADDLPVDRDRVRQEHAALRAKPARERRRHQRRAIGIGHGVLVVGGQQVRSMACC